MKDISIIIAAVIVSFALYAGLKQPAPSIQIPNDAAIAFRCDVRIEGNPCRQAYEEGFRWGLAQIPLQVGMDTASFCASRAGHFSADPGEDCVTMYRTELALDAWDYMRQFDENYYIHDGRLFPSKENYPLSYD